MLYILNYSLKWIILGLIFTSYLLIEKKYMKQGKRWCLIPNILGASNRVKVVSKERKIRNNWQISIFSVMLVSL